MIFLVSFQIDGLIILLTALFTPVSRLAVKLHVLVQIACGVEKLAAISALVLRFVVVSHVICQLTGRPERFPALSA